MLVCGVLEILHRDQGHQFEAEAIHSLCCAPLHCYNPKYNGVVGYHNRTLIDLLVKLLLSQRVNGTKEGRLCP